MEVSKCVLYIHLKKYCSRGTGAQECLAPRVPNSPDVATSCWQIPKAEKRKNGFILVRPRLGRWCASISKDCLQGIENISRFRWEKYGTKISGYMQVGSKDQVLWSVKQHLAGDSVSLVVFTPLKSKCYFDCQLEGSCSSVLRAAEAMYISLFAERVQSVKVTDYWFWWTVHWICFKKCSGSNSTNK